MAARMIKPIARKSGGAGSATPSPRPSPREERPPPPELGAQPRYGIIGGSGVSVQGKESWFVRTPYGECMVSAMDEEKRVLFVNRHLCTKFDENDKPSYAPPHEIEYRALCWALGVESKCQGGIIALASAGTLHPDTIPVGSVIMADDYFRVRPEPTCTFWGHASVGAFAAPEENGVGRVHYTPADPLDQGWCQMRKVVQEILKEVRPEKVPLCSGQTKETWPCIGDHKPSETFEGSAIYVQSEGPRFETRAEIRQYRSAGHFVGMTCGREWALIEELCLPYVLLTFCDNACNGLSTHPRGALEEYKEHKEAVQDVTAAVVNALVDGLPKASGCPTEARGA